MAEIRRAVLYGKLNSVAYKALESATIFAKMRGNPYVELAHWVHQILQLQDSDLHRIIRHFDVNPSRLASDLTAALDQFPRGGTSVSTFSPHLDDVVERGWFYCTLLFGESSIRTGHLVVGIAKTSNLQDILLNISGQFEKLKADDLTDNFGKIVGDSPEEGLGAKDGSQLAADAGAAEGEERAAGMAPSAMGRQEALLRFAIDLTERAREGDIDPIVGRDDEIRQIVDILMRRRQNNPILTGEAGVGKTAVVEGFAQRIVRGDVPPPLQNVSVRSLDLGLLQAGASMKGEFEKRLKQVIEEVQQSESPIILFIDEAHNLVGAGGSAGQGDAANLLKPALARGTLRTIAATTWAEYKKYFEKDPALTRRFQVVKVDEPTEDKAMQMARAVAGTLEKHHKVQILDGALSAAVELSHRYIPDRQLPDKAISLLDTVCARVAISQHAVPAEVENVRRRIEALETELQIIERETAVGGGDQERRAEIEEALGEASESLEQLEARWQEEQDRVESILELRAKLTGGDSEAVEEEEEEAPAEAEPEAEAAETEEEATEAAEAEEEADEEAAEPEVAEALAEEETEDLTEQLRQLQDELREIQGERPLVIHTVEPHVVASVVADWTGIPVGRMVRSQISNVLGLADRLEERVLGQRHALEAIARRMVTSRAGMVDPRRPVGVFMLAGPSGVGKTETALALAEALYGGEQNLITINMSEFQESHTVSTLKGAPPGYVGYGEGGVLTEAVRRRPYSVVLLDEVEKAHPDVHEIFYQVFDKGMMEDGEGRLIDFKNTVILLTTNAGGDLVMDMCQDPELMPDPDGLRKSLREPLLSVFPPALLGRLVVVPYYPIGDEVLREIIRLQLSRIQRRLRQNRDIELICDDEVSDLIARRCTEVESGARMVDAILTNTLLPEISRQILTRLMEEEEISAVEVTVDEEEFAYSFR